MSHDRVLAMLGLFGFVGSVLVVPLARRVALLYGVADQPGDRKLHATPVPYLGGVAIVLTAAAGTIWLENWTVRGAVILLAALAVAAVGLIDDMRTVRPMVRVAVEVGAATAVAASGVRVHLVPGPVDWLVTVAALVIVTNSFNLLDNMDGAASAIAAVIAIALAVAAGLGDQWLAGGLAALVAGTCVGFLCYNWHPATVFMGDAGSLFIGFLLGSVALRVHFPVDHGTSLAAKVLMFGAAFFDTTLVVVARVRSHRPIYLGATDHTSHRLLRLGIPTRGVVMLLAAGSTASAALGLALARGWATPTFVLPPAGVFVVAVFLALLRLPDGPEPDTERVVDVDRRSVREPAAVDS